MFGSGFLSTSAKELPVDAALGAVDAMDVLSNLDELAAMELWYHLLNSGLRVAISAGTDAFTNVSDHYTMGGGRVYVHTGGPLDYVDWIRNYKQGRSFASNRPVLLMTVDGKEPGDSLQFDTPRTVHIRTHLATQRQVNRMEIIVNGRVVSAHDIRSLKATDWEAEIPIEHSSWIACDRTLASVGIERCPSLRAHQPRPCECSR